MGLQIRQESLSRHGKNFAAYLIELENAIIGFFFEGGTCRFGTLALALPGSRQPPSPGSSSVLIGYKNVSIARILAEYLSSRYGKISLVSIFLRKEADIEDEKNLLELAKILK